MRDVLTELMEWWRAGETVGVATVVATFQSAPRPAGASMLVGPGGQAVGSVSGGCVEGGGEEGEGGAGGGSEGGLHKGAEPMKYPTGSIYNVTEMAPSSVNQAEWFELHFKVVDQNITVWINGEVYLEHVATLATGPGTKGIRSEGGRLAIQANSKDGAYYFQNISIKPLD